MRRTLRLVAATAALVLVLPVATVEATSPLDVSFEVQTSIAETPLGSGPFTASGPAVDAGLVCAAGDTLGVDGAAAGYESGRGLNVTVVKQFSCGDGSGMFWARLHGRIDARGDSFVWVIVGGTGDYARLRGTGSGTGEPLGELVVDHYAGAVHVD